jgi:tagatose-6-phosphate ketose/aldose isomerase
MKNLNRYATWREIHAQPEIWRQWGADLNATDLRTWVASLNVEEVWFCGAGSSAYIGDLLVALLEGTPGVRFRAVPTTDLVARPHVYLSQCRALVVNFGRSGNSTETIGTLDALDALAPNLPRLNITCNATSALGTRPAAQQRVIVLPEATHDAGFAMTSSFTTMLLTALAVFDPSLSETSLTTQLETLSDTLLRLLPKFRTFANTPRRPDRVVFVGSGPLAYAAREAALKVMELTAGRVPALWESTLGFRHGPKSFVRGATDIYVFGSADPHTAHYDADLVAELRTQFPASITMLIGPGGDLEVPTDGWASVLPIVLAQVMAVVWSDALGLPVDNPFAGQGTLSRVVSGVKLYAVAAK